LLRSARTWPPRRHMMRSIALLLPLVSLLSMFRLTGFFTEPRLSDAEIHAIAGERVQLPAVSRGSGALKIVTWNIERGVRFEPIVATLRALAPDIVLLQEVDRYCRRSGNLDVARELGRSLRMNWVSAGEFQEIGEARGSRAAMTGQAILSRYPISDASAIVFGNQSSLRWRWNPLQPRRGGRVALRAMTAGLLVYSLHLESLGGDGRRSSQLKDVIVDQSRHPAVDVVIAGDFNNAGPFQSSAMFARFGPAGFVDALGNVPHQTAVKTRHPIDWLFAKGATHATGRVERVDHVSDHYPVIATISW
jgi:endonuclease/exonuclease/phosphatase family metal-dependent hydrolase